MHAKIFATVLLFAFAISAFALTDEALSTYDLAPGVIPSAATPVDAQWDLQYSYDQLEAQSGDNGLLGIGFDGTWLWVSGRGAGAIPPMIYLFNPTTGVMGESFESGATSSWGCRDLCFDGIYMYAGWESGLICYDITTHAVVTTIPIPAGMSFQRANAYDPATDNFYAGNFGSTCYEQDRNGGVIRSWAAAPLTAVYGMAWDDDAPDGPWLWINDQTGGCNIHQFDPVTLTYTGFNIVLDPPGSVSPIAGGADYADGVVATHTSILVMGQGTPDAGAAFEMYISGPPPDYDVTCTLAPVGSTVIPANGGPLTFEGTITNNETFELSCPLWTSVTDPSGNVYELMDLTITMSAGQVITREREQYIPGWAPAGAYTYDLYVGYEALIWDEDHLDFTKSADGDGGMFVKDWSYFGEAFPGEVLPTAPIVSEYALGEAYPNPFNPTANIDFYLSEAGNVQLIVYDVTGREVYRMVNGWMDAGSHTATFYANHLASGVYFYKLTAGNFCETKKMMLLK